MPWLLLAISLVGFAFALNALRPTRAVGFMAQSFFGAWLTIELAPQVIIVQAVITVVLCLFGALSAWPGWVGLALTVVSWAILAGMVVQGRRTSKIMRAALVDVVGVGEGPRVPWYRLVMPFIQNDRRVRQVRRVEFARAGGRRLHVDVYQPKAPPEPGELRPAIVQIHGGAWVMGFKRQQALPLLNHLAANGWVAFDVDYRLSPFATWPDHLVDVKQAIAWVREHAAEYGVDPDFICVTGGSAGGHLTALTGLTANDPTYQPGFEHADTSVRAAVPLYGIYDFTNRLGSSHKNLLPLFLEPWVMKAFYEDDPEAFHAASPIDLVHPDAPPFLVIHGDRDTLAPVLDARLFVERLREASDAPVLYAELRGAQHAFDTFSSLRADRTVEAVERFLHWVHQEYLAGRTGAEAGAGAVGDTDIPTEAIDERPSAPSMPG